MRQLTIISLAFLLCAGCTDNTPKKIPSKAPIQGAFGWKLGEVLPPQEHELHGSYGTMASVPTGDPVFLEAQLSITADRKIYEIRMLADPKNLPQIEAALQSKYGAGSFSCNRPDDLATMDWTNGTRQLRYERSTNVIVVLYSDLALAQSAHQERDAALKDQAGALSHHL